MNVSENDSNCNNTGVQTFDTIAVERILYSRTTDIRYVIVVPCVMIFNLLVNSAFLYTVYHSPNLHTVTNVYLVNVAIADILFVEISCILGHLTAYLLSPNQYYDYYGGIGCILSFVVGSSCYFVSLILLTFVTMERYFAICHPIKHRLLRGKFRTTKIIFASWIYALLLSTSMVPLVLSFETFCVVWPSEERELRLNIVSFCVIPQQMTVVLVFILDMVLFLIGAIINVWLYVSIILALFRRANTSSDSNRQKAEQDYIQVAKLLIINGSAFLICQTPHRAIKTSNELMFLLRGTGFLNSTLYSDLQLFNITMLYLSSIINPIIYISVSSTYRNAFMKAFHLK